jgi:hypothetical protein
LNLVVFGIALGKDGCAKKGQSRARISGITQDTPFYQGFTQEEGLRLRVLPQNIGNDA